MNLVERAIEIAVAAHKGQRDKVDAPYILHPLRLMTRMKTEDEMIAAVLHDVVEDTSVTLNNLRDEGFDEALLRAIDCLTHRVGESYENYIERVESNAIARQVKIADLEDNMDVRRITNLGERDLRRLEKYTRTWHQLTHRQDSLDSDS